MQEAIHAEESPNLARRGQEHHVEGQGDVLPELAGDAASASWGDATATRRVARRVGWTRPGRPPLGGGGPRRRPAGTSDALPGGPSSPRFFFFCASTPPSGRGGRPTRPERSSLGRLRVSLPRVYDASCGNSTIRRWADENSSGKIMALESRVFVQNVPPHCGERELRAHFREYDVTDVSVPKRGAIFVTLRPR